MGNGEAYAEDLWRATVALWSEGDILSWLLGIPFFSHRRLLGPVGSTFEDVAVTSSHAGELGRWRRECRPGPSSLHEASVIVVPGRLVGVKASPEVLETSTRTPP